jgi:hypothetical protein
MSARFMAMKFQLGFGKALAYYKSPLSGHPENEQNT